jgi:hypothetical protein
VVFSEAPSEAKDRRRFCVVGTSVDTEPFLVGLAALPRGGDTIVGVVDCECSSLLLEYTIGDDEGALG